MSSLNSVHLIGHLGKDPKVANLNNGGRVVTFSVATSERWKDKSTGEPRERTDWHNIVIFNEPIGKIAEQFLKKGSRVYLEGALQTRKYTDQAGVERYTTEVVLKAFDSKLVLLDRAERATPNPDDYGTTSRRPATAEAAPASGADFDDDIPF